MAAMTYANSIDIIDKVCYTGIITTNKRSNYKMNITIKDKTPNTNTLEFISYEDVFGRVLLTKGWR